VHPFWPLLLVACRRAAFDFNLLIFLMRLIDICSRLRRFDHSAGVHSVERRAS
jgi:hypothetical protein